MSIWSHALEKEAEVKVASFIDDGNFRAEGPHHAIRTANATTISVELISIQVLRPMLRRLSTSLHRSRLRRS
eukprot:4715065-Pyramimonas_sp.AAC.1